MTLASTSRTQVRYIPEATPGVTPGAGTTKNLRVTGEDFNYTINKTESEEINATRTISSVIPVDASAAGSINFEMQYGEYDPFLAALTQDAWAVYGTNGVGTTFTADFTATTITASVAPTGGSAFTTLARGQYFQINAPATANHLKIFRVHKTTAPTATVITLDATTPAVVASTVAGNTVRTSRLSHGSTQQYFSIERDYTDVTQLFVFRGQTPRMFELSLQSGSKTTGKFDFLGLTAARGVTTFLPASPTASLGYDIHSGVSGSSCILVEGGTPLTFVKSISMSYDNNLREQKALCSLGSVGIGAGTIGCKLNAEVYFSDGALFDKFLANTNTELVFSTLDSVGNGYVFSFPNCNLTDYKVSAGSKDQDLMAQISFTALNDASNAVAALRKPMFIDRVGVAVVP